MITDYIGGEGSAETPKNDYVIYGWPLIVIFWSKNRFRGILLIHDRVKMQFNAAIVTHYPDPWSLLSWKNQSFIIWSFEQNLNPLCNTGGHSHHRCHCVFSWCEGRWFDTVLDWFRSRNSSTNALWVKAHWEGSIQIFPFLHENITFTF